VPRVKKSGGKAGKAARPRANGVKRAAARGGSGPQSTRRSTKRKKALPAKARLKDQPVRIFKVRELNAQQKCGPGTSVERLFRVDETVDGSPRAHLVFLDRRHGWYCEHGVECPAVNHARRT
jgi:hypothetical protein